MKFLSLLLIGITVSVAGSGLKQPILTRLQLGTSKPLGWLRDELLLQARGLTGQLPYFWHYFNNSFWLGPKGSQPEQFIPYYLNGLVPLSYLINDTNLNDIRHRYLTYILSQQDKNKGWLGPALDQNTTTDAKNYWSKYLAVEAFEAYADAESDMRSRVINALVRHHQAFYDHVTAQNPAFFIGRWSFARYSDAIVGIQWLIDQGRSDPFLFDLMDMIREQSDTIMRKHGNYSWEDWYEKGNPFTHHNDSDATQHLLRHGVDIGQGIKTGALWWRVSGDRRDLENPYTAIQWFESYLHMSDGMYFADENVPADPKSHTPSRGTETCSVVETMYSMRMAYEITGNITFMDRLERLAFNSLPAALWPDVTANVYHHCSNQIVAPGGGNQFGYNIFFCCTANVHQGWPKFAMSPVHLIDDAIVVSSYVPSSTIFPDNGTLIVDGQYPFSDNVTMHFSLTKSLDVHLRVPCWTLGASIILNKKSVEQAPSCSFFIKKLPVGKTKLYIAFNNNISIYRWPNGAAEVHRGGLTFALRPTEKVTATLINGTIMERDVSILSPWNYAIDLNSLDFTCNGIVPKVPFSTTEEPPVKILVQGRRVPKWTAGSGARGVAVPPDSPVTSAEPLESLELVPFGSTNVRISVFPVLK